MNLGGRVRPCQRDGERGEGRRRPATGHAVEQKVAVGGVPPERLLALLVGLVDETDRRRHPPNLSKSLRVADIWARTARPRRLGEVLALRVFDEVVEQEAVREWLEPRAAGGADPTAVGRGL